MSDCTCRVARVLESVAKAAERDTETPHFRSSNKPTDPSQVYSIRIPVARLEEIRRIATEYDMQPTTMLRHWILDRLDRQAHTFEIGGETDARDLASFFEETKRRTRLRRIDGAP